MSLVLEMIHLILRCDNPLLTFLILMLRLMNLKISQSLKPLLILKILKVLILRLLLILKRHPSKLPLTLDPPFFPCWTRTKTRMGNLLGSYQLCPRATPFWWTLSTLFCWHHCYPQVELQLSSGRSTLLSLWFFLLDHELPCSDDALKWDKVCKTLGDKVHQVKDKNQQCIRTFVSHFIQNNTNVKILWQLPTSDISAGADFSLKKPVHCRQGCWVITGYSYMLSQARCLQTAKHHR